MRHISKRIRRSPSQIEYAMNTQRRKRKKRTVMQKVEVHIYHIEPAMNDADLDLASR